jgi:hypothetical protein
MSQDLIARLRARPCESIGPPAIELEAAARIETLMAHLPIPRTDEQILEQTEELAAELAQLDGYVLTSGNFRDHPAPRVRMYWERACVAQRALTAPDPEDAESAIDGEEPGDLEEQPPLPGYDLAKLTALAQAAETGGQHIFTNPRDSNAWQANDAWHQAATPELFLALVIALGAQRGGVSS